LDKQEEHLILDIKNTYTTLAVIIVTPGIRTAYGTMMDTMDIIAMGRKGKHLNTLETYYTYKTSRENIHMNDTHIDTYNPIFEALQVTDAK
jgi:hypothetical protein